MTNVIVDWIFFFISVAFFFNIWSGIGESYGLDYTFTLGLLGVIACRELVRYIVAKNCGIKLRVPWIWPIGSVPSYLERSNSIVSESYAAICGLVASALASYVFVIAGSLLSSSALLAAGYAGAGITLFCLIPLPPLDGGIALLSLSAWSRVPGMFILAWLTFQGGIFSTFTFAMAAFVIAIASVLDTVFRSKYAEEHPDYSATESSAKLTVIALYALTLGMVLII